jgi:hypothetical protein
MNFDKFDFKDLDATIRSIMLTELEYDFQRKSLYKSKRFSENGNLNYYSIFKNVLLLNGNELDLSNALLANNCFLDNVPQKRGDKIILVSVPKDAHLTFAQGEFNRYYIRAICIKAKAEGKKIIVYRARQSQNPRDESQHLIGTALDPDRLLLDVRANIGRELLYLPGVNSGLSVRFEA